MLSSQNGHYPFVINFTRKEVSKIATNRHVDKESVRPYADAFAVASALGIEMKKKGKTTYIRCLDPGHNDKHMSNCVLYKNGCHCFACGKDKDVFEMVKVVRGCGMNEAVNFVADACGIQVSDDYKPVRMPISAEERELIGVHTSSLRDFSGRLLINNTLEKLFTENPREFRRLVYSKAVEKMYALRSEFVYFEKLRAEIIAQGKQEYSGFNLALCDDAAFSDLRRFYADRIEKCKEIARRMKKTSRSGVTKAA